LESPSALSELFPPLGVVVSPSEGLLECFLRREVEFPTASALELVKMRHALERERMPINNRYSAPVILHP